MNSRSFTLSYFVKHFMQELLEMLKSHSFVSSTLSYFIIINMNTQLFTSQNLYNVTSRLPSHPACQAIFSNDSDFNCYLRGLNTIQSKSELLFSSFNTSFFHFLRFLELNTCMAVYVLFWLQFLLLSLPLVQNFFGSKPKKIFYCNSFCLCFLRVLRILFFYFNSSGIMVILLYMIS